MYSDTPHLYGPAGGSLNILRVEEKVEEGGLLKTAKGEVEKKDDEDDGRETGIEEGGQGSGLKQREESGMPAKAEERKRWFLKEGSQKWVWEAGRVYQADFFNPYLDFNGQLSLAALLNLFALSGGKIRGRGSEQVFFFFFFFLAEKIQRFRFRAEITRVFTVDIALSGWRGLSPVWNTPPPKTSLMNEKHKRKASVIIQNNPLPLV